MDLSDWWITKDGEYLLPYDTTPILDKMEKWLEKRMIGKAVEFESKASWKHIAFQVPLAMHETEIRRRKAMLKHPDYYYCPSPYEKWL